MKVDEKIIDHQEKYIHIRWGDIGRFFALLGSISLAIANFFLLHSIGNTYKVWELLAAEDPQNAYQSFSQLIIIYPLITEYILIGLCFISLIGLIKGGVNKLDNDDIEPLVYLLIFGIGTVLISGLITGIINGLVEGILCGLIGGLIVQMLLGISFIIHLITE